MNYKKILIATLFLSLSRLTIATGVSEIDSLWTNYQKENIGKEKAQIKNEIISYYLNNNNIDTAIVLANENKKAISLLKDTGLLLLNNYKQFGIIYFNKKNELKGVDFFEKALKIANRDDYKKEYIEVLFLYAHNESLSNRIDKADSLLNIALNYINAINKRPDEIKKAMAMVYKTKSFIFIRKNIHLDSARYYLRLCTSLLKESDEASMYVSSYINYGYTYAVESQLDSGVVYFVKALKIAEKHDMYSQQSTCLENIGVIYHMLKQHEKAYFYYKKSEILAMKLNSGFRDRSSIYSSLANIFIDRVQLDSLTNLIPKILSIQDSLHDFDKVHPYIILSTIYTLKKNIDSAYFYSQKAKKIIEDNELKNIPDYNHIWYLEGKYSEEKGFLNQAIQSYNKALLNCTDLKLQADINKALFFIFKNKKNNIKAVYHIEQYAKFNDSLNNIQNLIQINDATTRYETEKKEAENKLLIAKNAEQQLFSKSELLKKQGWIGATVATFLLAFITVLWFRQRHKNTHYQLMVEKRNFNQQMSEQENRNLQRILDALEEERTRISQDLHDRIGAGISTIRLYFEGIKEQIKKKDEPLIQAFSKIDTLLITSIEEVRKVSHNISSSILENFGLKSAILEIKNTVEKSGMILLTFSDKNLNHRLEKNVEINTYRIIQELISNSIKHGECNQIDIVLKFEESNLLVEYKDNGKGFDPAKNNDGQGEGNMKTRVYQMGGSIENVSKVTKGAFYILIIPTISIVPDE